MNLLLSILLFGLAIFLISWGADTVIDEIEEIADNFHLSGVAIAFLILGVDLEETLASWSSAWNGFPEIALGNVIGNSIISISLCFALPALFFTIKFDKISPIYMIFLAILGGLNLGVAFFPEFGWIWGITACLIFVTYGIWNFRQISKAKLDNEKIKTQPKNEEDKESAGKLEWKDLVLGILGLVALILGSDLLVSSIEGLLQNSPLTEAVIGVGLVAAATNVEEYFLLFKSIQKKKEEIGIAALLGKVIWNLGITFGVSLLILAGFGKTIAISNIIRYLNLLFLAILVPLLGFSGFYRKQMGKGIAGIFLGCFAIYLGLLFV